MKRIERRPRKYVHGIPTFFGAYEDYKQEVMTYGARGWNAETTRQYDGIVLNHLVPYLQDHDRRHIGELTRQDYEMALNSLWKRGKNPPDAPYEPWDENGVPEKVDYLMHAVVSTAAKHLLCEDVFGPKEIHRNRGSGGGRTGDRQARTMKSLTVKQDIETCKYLQNRMDQTGPEPGLMLMYALGLRNNEACGVNFGHIHEFYEHPGYYYLIIPQTTQLGTNELKIMGKTANSGRRIPLPNGLMRHIIALRDKRMREVSMNGHAANPDELPIACRRKNPLERCSADDLSRAARLMFQRIGMRSEDLVALHLELMEDFEAARDEMEQDEFREIESEPTAYLLRRNFATQITILGLSEAEIRYIIGHKIEDEYIQRRAFGDEKMLYRIKQKLDKRPLLNTIYPEQSMKAEPNSRMSFSGSKKIVLNLQTEEITNVRLNITAKEPGDEICITIPDKPGNTILEADYMACSTEIPVNPERTIDVICTYHNSYLRQM